MFVLITIVSSFCSSNSVLKVSFSAHASIGLQVPARHRKPVAGDSFLLVCTSDDFWAIPSYTAVAPSCSNRALLWRFCPDMHPSHGLGQQPTDRPTVTLHLSGKKILFSHSSDRIVKPPFSSHFTRHFRNKYSIKRAGIIIIFFFFTQKDPRNCATAGVTHSFLRLLHYRLSLRQLLHTLPQDCGKFSRK